MMLSSTDMSHPDPAVACLTESPASEVPPITVSLETADNFDAGLQIDVQHKRDLDEYRKIFNRNMENKPVKHDRVFVLIWTWADAIDDLKVKVEVSHSPQLRTICAQTYSQTGGSTGESFQGQICFRG
jgi:hypothetical protein